MITGCSGGGKSTLTQALARAGYATVPEPGRRIVKEERAGSGRALPWVDPEGFARRALEMATRDLEGAGAVDTFFDRGTLDAHVALHHLTGAPVPGEWPYSQPVFCVPPWREIFVNDAERMHDFGVAEAEYRRILTALGASEVQYHIVPKLSVEERLAFVLERI
ncbi:AAA family ATPase [Candidatus Rhodobacter oscarellae]|uniref:AAA family ATPase n=1 Tax=Candidatus Rhodobacter oscarellae TaxID=1675527 RepID=UPI001F3FDE25|nr:AAA family ATPase [Candidatus Rhodobacter lobularis]